MDHVNRNLNERQLRLFSPLSVPRRQPHEQTFDEFARSPRTMWHGSDEPTVEHLRESGYRSQGFHVGTLKAAHERRTAGAYNKGGFLHPVRITPGTMENDQYDPSTHISDKGEDWDAEFEGGNYYRNHYEDRGSVSAILQSSDDVKSYVDHLHEAAGAGKRLGGYQQETLDRVKRSKREVELGQRGDRDIEYPSVRVHDTELVKTDEVLTHAPRNLIAGQSEGFIQPGHPAYGDKTLDPVHRYDYDNTTRPRAIAAMRGPQFRQPEMFEPGGIMYQHQGSTVETVHPHAMTREHEEAHWDAHNKAVQAKYEAIAKRKGI